VGLLQLTDASGNPYTYRTNIANSLHKGIETYIEFSPTRLAKTPSSMGQLSFFNSFAYVDARYTSGPYKGNSVEYAPATVDRFGITYGRRFFSTTFVISHTSQSFADASNTSSSHDAIVGIIPAYTVMDWSATVHPCGKWNIKLGVNNLSDNRYFTLRTDEYPGPGIIPAIGRNAYVSFGVRL
jgi:Fe(3+) dicitrate transport protein